MNNEPNWNGLYVCIDCGKGISILTADSYQGKCVSCFIQPKEGEIGAERTHEKT